MKTNQVETKFVAHRGYSMKAPENTIPAFELAGQSDFWGIELDTYCTKDGRWVVFHDRTVDRMTNGTGPVHEKTFSEIMELEIKSGYGIEQYHDLKIPTLESVLDVCRKYNLHVFLEIKYARQDEDLQNLLNIVQEKELMESTLIIDFEAERLEKIRGFNDMITLGYLINKKPDVSDFAFVKELGRTFLDCNYTMLTSEDVQLCHEQGVELSIWTVNEFELAKPFIDAGVDYITTDTALHLTEKSAAK